MSVLSSLFRLCANSPAPTSSTSDSAACSTTSPRCSREALPVVRPRSAAQRIRGLGLRRDPRRRHAEQHARQQRQPERKSDHRQRRARVDRHILARPGNASISSMRAPAYATASPATPPSAGEQHALRQQLPNDPGRASRPAPCAPTSPPSVPCRAPAADSQCSRTQSAAPAPAIHISRCRLRRRTAPACLDARRPPASAPHATFGSSVLPCSRSKKSCACANDCRSSALTFCLQRSQRHARLHPPDDVEPVDFRVVHVRRIRHAPASTQSADRNPAACSTAGRHKTLRRNSHNRHRLRIHPERAAHHRRHRRRNRAATSRSSSPRSSARPAHRPHPSSSRPAAGCSPKVRK